MTRSNNKASVKSKKNLHQNIADVLTNDTGIDVLVEFVEIISEICMDPQAHNSIILLFDVVTDNLENPVVAKSLGNVFFWIRKVMKNPDFQLALHESMRGVNKLFDRIDVLQPMLDTMFRNIQKLFDDPNFDSTFELVVENITTLINMKKKRIIQDQFHVDETIRCTRGKSFFQTAPK